MGETDSGNNKEACDKVITEVLEYNIWGRDNDWFEQFRNTVSLPIPPQYKLWGEKGDWHDVILREFNSISK